MIGGDKVDALLEELAVIRDGLADPLLDIHEQMRAAVQRLVQVEMQQCAECERMRAGLSLIAADEHHLMNITARQTAISILQGKPAQERPK